MRTALRFTTIALLLYLTGLTAMAQTPPPAGTWAQIANTALYDAVAFEAKAESALGGTPELWSPQGLFAYSGTELATVGGKLGFVLWGGGDGDSPNNQLLFTPFDGSGPMNLSGPYLAPDRVYRYPEIRETWRDVSRNAPPPVTVAAAPKARHTFRNLRFFQSGGHSYLFSHGGELYWPASCTEVTRVFDLTQTFVQAMARPDMGWELRQAGPECTLTTASGWDTTKRVMVSRGRNLLSTYDPVANEWTIRATPGGGTDFQAGAAMDVPGRKMYVLAWNLAEQIDLDTYTVTPITAQWRSLLDGSQGPGVAWHQASKRLILWVGGQTLYRIDPMANTVEQATMGGLTVPAPLNGGTYGSFDVIPNTDTLVLLNSVADNVFVGTLPVLWAPWGITNPPPPPPPPSGPVTLTASPATITSGQSSVLTLSLPTLDYHNIFINSTRPLCVPGGTTFSCAVTVAPTATTIFQAAATNSAGTPYIMPSVVVTVQDAPPPTSVTLNAPAVLNSSTGVSTTSGFYALSMAATTAPKTFAPGTAAAAFRYRIVEIATGYINDDLQPYSSGAPHPSVWPVLRGGQYDISIYLEDAAGQVLIDASGTVAAVGPRRIDVPTR